MRTVGASSAGPLLVATASVLAGMALGWGVTGCRSAAHRPPGGAPKADISFPLWLTAPAGEERTQVPVSLDFALPPHLLPLAADYGLPGWVVYGVVRALGADEFIVSGTYRHFTVTDQYGESRVVVDDVRYHVPEDRVRQALAAIAKACADAENELTRLNVLGAFVRRRVGGYILFGLSGSPGERPAPVSKEANLLLTSGESRDPVEVFTLSERAGLPPVGWKETPTHYATTMIGAFQYGDPLGSFRRAEEEAIRDLATSLVVRFSHMGRKLAEEGVATRDGDYQEDAFREDITLRIRGLRVTRRAVDLRNGACVVVLEVPRDGVRRLSGSAAETVPRKR